MTNPCDNSGGHAAVADSLHESLKLARRLRARGFATDFVQAADLASCRMYEGARAAWNGFASIVLPHVGAGSNEMLVCGMALGYADEQQTVNSFHTPREPVESFTHWLE